jgi:hypothetical protein
VLIGDPVRQALVMLDLAVEFEALVTHRNPARIVKRSNLNWSPDLKTIESKDCSLKNLWPAAIECSEGFALESPTGETAGGGASGGTGTGAGAGAGGGAGSGPGLVPGLERTLQEVQAAQCKAPLAKVPTQGGCSNRSA